MKPGFTADKAAADHKHVLSDLFRSIVDIKRFHGVFDTGDRGNNGVGAYGDNNGVRF